MSPFESAIATLRNYELQTPEENEALRLLIRTSLRMRKALKFYAEPHNWLDGVPMLNDPQTGLLTHVDGGLMARKALQKDDYVLDGPAVRVATEEGNVHGLETRTGSTT